jgi:hypothetical protein
MAQGPPETVCATIFDIGAASLCWVLWVNLFLRRASTANNVFLVCCRLVGWALLMCGCSCWSTVQSLLQSLAWWLAEQRKLPAQQLAEQLALAVGYNAGGLTTAAAVGSNTAGCCRAGFAPPGAGCMARYMSFVQRCASTGSCDWLYRLPILQLVPCCWLCRTCTVR